MRERYYVFVCVCVRTNTHTRARVVHVCSFFACAAMCQPFPLMLYEYVITYTIVSIQR
jgi:hypothetical protein